MPASCACRAAAGSAISRRTRRAAAPRPFETVLAADVERAALIEEAEHSHDPDRLGELHERLNAIDAHAAPARAARILVGLGFDEAAAASPARHLLGRLADAGRAGLAAVLGAGPAAARRAVEPSRPRGGAVARGLPQILSRHDPAGQPRARLPQQCRRPHPPPRSRQADALSGRLRRVRAPARRAPGAARLGQGAAGGASAPSCRTISPATAPAPRPPSRRSRGPRRWRGCSRSPSCSTIRA